jgi:multisubunit Na+/H+ antiporter MnhE subunit
VTRSRRILAIVCIAVVVVTALTPAAVDLLTAVLVAIDPLFGGLVAVAAERLDDVRLAPAPLLAAHFARPPPIV